MGPAHVSAAPAAGKGVLLFLAGSIAPSIEISRVKYHKKSSTLSHPGDVLSRCKLLASAACAAPRIDKGEGGGQN